MSKTEKPECGCRKFGSPSDPDNPRLRSDYECQFPALLEKYEALQDEAIHLRAVVRELRALNVSGKKIGDWHDMEAERDTLQSRVTELEREVERLKPEAVDKFYATRARRIEEQAKEIERLREVIESNRHQ